MKRQEMLANGVINRVAIDEGDCHWISGETLMEPYLRPPTAWAVLNGAQVVFYFEENNLVWKLYCLAVMRRTSKYKKGCELPKRQGIILCHQERQSCIALLADRQRGSKSAYTCCK